MKTQLLLAAAALLVTMAPAHAQATISEGMSQREVQDAFGAPATTRAAGEWTYWYYHNGCPRRCGSDDVVFFRGDRVVAAVLRTSARRFSGPRADRALEAASPGDARRPAEGEPVVVGEVRVEAPPR